CKRGAGGDLNKPIDVIDWQRFSPGNNAVMDSAGMKMSHYVNNMRELPNGNSRVKQDYLPERRI
ncbi:MAG: hypothetical protein WBK64_05190, partial [Dethiobacteria bacterium]